MGKCRSNAATNYQQKNEIPGSNQNITKVELLEMDSFQSQNIEIIKSRLNGKQKNQINNEYFKSICERGKYIGTCLEEIHDKETNKRILKERSVTLEYNLMEKSINILLDKTIYLKIQNIEYMKLEDASPNIIIHYQNKSINVVPNDIGIYVLCLAICQA